MELEGQETERECGQLAGGGWGLSRAVTWEPGEGLGRLLGRSGRDPAGPPGPAPQWAVFWSFHPGSGPSGKGPQGRDSSPGCIHPTAGIYPIHPPKVHIYSPFFLVLLG